MDDPPSLDELAATAERAPGSLSYRALCDYLSSEDTSTRCRAEDIRTTALAGLGDPAPAIEALRSLLVAPDDDRRRAAVETLSRVARPFPNEVVAAVAPDLDAEDARRRGAAADILSRARTGAVRPHATALLDSVSDPDPRVGALALNAVAGFAEEFPEVVAPRIDVVEPFLRDEFVPEDGRSGMRVIYSRLETEADTDDGEPGPERLTNRAVRPFESAIAVCDAVSLTQPETVEPYVPRLVELALRETPLVSTSRLLRIATRVARVTPEVVDPVQGTVRDIAESDGPGAPTARNLRRELGADIPPREPHDLPAALATRDRPHTEADEDVLSGIDQRAMSGDLGLDDILPLLYSEDTDTRDHAAWGMSCAHWGAAAVDERATEFLGLFNEPDDCTRGHIRQVLWSVVSARPEAWAPPLAELATHEDPLVREMATGLLGTAAGASPAFTRRYLPIVVDRLDDQPEIRSRAFSTLASFVGAYPEETAAHVPGAVADLERRAAPSGALRYLRCLTRARPDAVDPYADEIRAFVTDLAGPDAIEERPVWELGSCSDVTEVDRALDTALEVCLWLAKSSPAAVAPLRPTLEAITAGRYYGRDSAHAVLATLDTR